MKKGEKFGPWEPPAADQNAIPRADCLMFRECAH